MFQKACKEGQIDVVELIQGLKTPKNWARGNRKL